MAEKIVIAWVARLPPAMDNSLNNNALNMLLFGPVFLLMNGFWIVDNKVIFNNEWSYIMRITDQMKSGHVYEGFHITQSTPMLMFVFFAWGLKIITAIIPHDTLNKLGFTMDQ